jgi:hypothetical protein
MGYRHMGILQFGQWVSKWGGGLTTSYPKKLACYEMGFCRQLMTVQRRIDIRHCFK